MRLLPGNTWLIERTQPRMTRPLRSAPITGTSSLLRPVRRRVPHRYSAPRGFRRFGTLPLRGRFLPVFHPGTSAKSVGVGSHQNPSSWRAAPLQWETTTSYIQRLARLCPGGRGSARSGARPGDCRSGSVRTPGQRHPDPAALGGAMDSDPLLIELLPIAPDGEDPVRRKAREIAARSEVARFREETERFTAAMGISLDQPGDAVQAGLHLAATLSVWIEQLDAAVGVALVDAVDPKLPLNAPGYPTALRRVRHDAARTRCLARAHGDPVHREQCQRGVAHSVRALRPARAA